MKKQENSSFWIRCVGHKTRFEDWFTIGREYEVRDGCVTNDNGFEYDKDPKMLVNSDPNSWYLSGWYEFEIVEEAPAPKSINISLNDLLGEL